MSYGLRPAGLADVKLVPEGGSAVDLPAAQVFSFTERMAALELEGDDRVVAVASWPVAIDWQLEAGGISLEALEVLTGRTISSSAGVKTFSAAEGDVFPYFAAYGRSLGDDGDDVHLLVYAVKVTRLVGSMRNGEFYVTQCRGVGVDRGDGYYDVVQNENATNLPSS